MTPQQFKNKRIELGYTQRSLAAALNLGKNGYRTVQRYESGDIVPSNPVIKLLRYIERFGDID